MGDNPSNRSFDISTKIGILTIKEHSIDKFIAHEEVTDPLGRYTISSNNIDFTEEIFLNIDDRNRSKLFVSGSDQSWVLNKFQQINDFIDRKLQQYQENNKRIER